MIIFSRIYANSFLQRRKIYRRVSHSHFHSLKDLIRIQEHAWLILEKHQESVSLLLDDMYPSSECGDNTDNQLNAPLTNSNESDGNTPNPEKTISEPKDSKGELASPSVADKKNEDPGLINPPSIFLQATMKNKRKSTGSIFEERLKEDELDIANEGDEEYENEVMPSSELPEEEKKKSEKTLNNEDNSKQTLSDGNMNFYNDEKKNTNKLNSSSLPSDKFYSEKDSSINVNSFKNNSRAKEMQKILSNDRESKNFSEKDTMHLLQNFDKLEKRALLDRLNSTSHKTTNTTHLSEKRNIQSIFSYSKSTSYITSLHKFLKKRNTTTCSSLYKSTHNKKANYSDYLKNTLFWYDFEKMAQFENYFPHNNMENVVKVIKGNNFLRILKMNDLKYITEFKKSFHSNQANTSYSSKKTSQKSKAKQSMKSNEEEIAEGKKNTEGLI